MSQQIVSARVDNGKVLLLNEQGGTSNQFGSTYAVAAVCGDDLVVVSESGTVDLYAIEGGTRPSYKRGLGSSPGPVSIQLGTNLNFSVQRSNGQTDVYVGGSKSRTTGTPNYGTKSNTSEKESTPSYTSDDDSGGGSLYVSDSFAAGIGRRCKACFTEPSTGPWAKVVLWIAGVASVATAIVVGMDSSFLTGIIAGATTFAAGYFLRHGWARCLVRSHYGLPAFIAAVIIYNSYPAIGGWLIFGSILLWFWPLWPLMAIIAVLAVCIAAGLGKSVKTVGD